MSNQAYLSIRIHFVLSVFVLQYALTANAQEQPKPNAIIVDDGNVQFPNGKVEEDNNKKLNAGQQIFQRALMRLRKSQRNKISPEAKKRADQALMHMSILTSYYVDNVRDAAKVDLNKYNKALFGNSANRFVTTNEVRTANGYMPKSGNPYIDMANDSLTDRIRQILATNPTRRFTLYDILANLRYMDQKLQISGNSNTSGLSDNDFHSLDKDLNVIEILLNQLADSGQIKREDAKKHNIYKVILEENNEDVLLVKYLGSVYYMK